MGQCPLARRGSSQCFAPTGTSTSDVLGSDLEGNWPIMSEQDRSCSYCQSGCVIKDPSVMPVVNLAYLVIMVCGVHIFSVHWNFFQEAVVKHMSGFIFHSSWDILFVQFAHRDLMAERTCRPT